MCGRTLFTLFCAVSPYSRNVLPPGGASERSSAGPSTHSFTMGGTTSGNHSILVMTLITCLENFLQPHNTQQQRSSSTLRTVHPKSLFLCFKPLLSILNTESAAGMFQTANLLCGTQILTWVVRPKSRTAVFALTRRDSSSFFHLIASYLAKLLKILV